MNFKSHETKVKLRGGYYTPHPIAAFLSRWVLSGDTRTILEPSCGDGAFIAALMGQVQNKVEFTGVEIDAYEAEKSRQLAAMPGRMKASIVHADFLEWANQKFEDGSKFDAVLGN